MRSKRFTSALATVTRRGAAHLLPAATLALMALLASACEEDSELTSNEAGAGAHPRDAGADLQADASEPDDPRYVVSSVLFDPGGSQTTYVSVLESLGEQELDYRAALEIGGWGDVWVHQGFVYISSGDEPQITKHAVTRDGRLVQVGDAISFAAYETDAKFWSNTFVAPNKAYMIHGVGGYVIWNPMTMEIEGSFDLPELPERPPFILRSGTLDRSNVIRDGKLYQPMYWSDEDYALFPSESRVVVIDIASDSIDAVLEAPCAGLDVGTQDAEGNLYFSTWTGGVYQPLLAEGEDNCVVKIAKGATRARADFSFRELTDGREGAAVRHFHGERLLLSVFHHDRVDGLAELDDPWAAIADLNWRTWVYDPARGRAEPVDAIDWNSGATYVFPVDDAHYVLVPDKDYATTQVLALHEDLSTSHAFELRGWGTRIFRLR